MKRTAEQADLDGPSAAAAAAGGAAAAATPAGEAGDATPGLPPVVASAIEQLETIWAGLPVRTPLKVCLCFDPSRI
eukprot:COSAG02_NODE_61193_length_269_cov_0.611765_1_plen_75_part_01